MIGTIITDVYNSIYSMGKGVSLNSLTGIFRFTGKYFKKVFVRFKVCCCYVMTIPLTRWTVKESWFDSLQGAFCSSSKRPRWIWSTPSLQLNRSSGALSPSIKWSRYDTDHSPHTVYVLVRAQGQLIWCNVPEKLIPLYWDYGKRKPRAPSSPASMEPLSAVSVKLVNKSASIHETRSSLFCSQQTTTGSYPAPD